MSYTSKTTLRVLDIIDGTIVDGPGLRTSIYLAGCAHQCPGCHNPQSWDFEAGKDMAIDDIIDHIAENQFPVTLSGGDPLYQMPALIELCKRLKAKSVNIWCYTGYNYEDIAANPQLSDILQYIDVLVDGPFILAQRDISLRFKGSANQRLIDVAASSPDHIILWTDNQTI